MKSGHQFLAAAICGLVTAASLAAVSPDEVLQRALAYHDPDNEWSTAKARLEIAETRPDGDGSRSTVELDNSRTWMRVDLSGKEAYEVTVDQVEILTGDKDAERGLMIRNYFLYLWGLPMKLTDPGTELELESDSSEIHGRGCDILRVAYEKETWFFHIDQESGRMRQYEFYWDDEKTKGEIITLEGEVTLGSMRIPQTRTWYKLPGNELLGTDHLDVAELTNH